MQMNKIKKIISLFIMSLPIFSANLSCDAQGNTYYVSTYGNDANAGTINAPFATINRGIEAVSAGDILIIRGGEYAQTATFSKGGTQNAPLTVSAYNGEKVVISGADRVENWTLFETINGKSVYKANIGTALGREDMVFCNGNIVDYAKWPNNTVDNNPIRSNTHDTSDKGLQDKWLFPTWAFVDSATGIPSDTSVSDKYYGTIYDSELPFASGELVGATLLIKSGMGWYMYSGKITDSDIGSFYIDGEMQFSDYYRPKEGNAYYICGSKMLLDYENEWYCDNGGNIYLIMPDNSDPNNADIRVKKRKYALDLNGKDYINIEGIDCFSGEINMNSCNNVNLKGITVDYVNNGINMTGNYNSITKSSVRHSKNELISVGGYGNRVINNLFEYGNASGGSVNIAQSENAVVAYNTVRFTGNTGIGLNNKGRAVITHNDISYFSAVCYDNGGIYGGTFDGVNTEVSYNRVHDGMSSLTAGIYTDNGTANILIHHNVTWNSQKGFQTNIPRSNILVYNNTFAGSGGTSWLEIDFSENCRFMNNLITDDIQLDMKGIWLPDGKYVKSGTKNSIFIKFNNIALPLERLKENANENFYPNQLDEVVDKGILISGITDNYCGNSPDVGAYEYGNPKWRAGHDFSDDSLSEMQFLKTENVQSLNHIENGGFEISDISKTAWVKTGNKEAVTKERTSSVFSDNAAVHTGIRGLVLGNKLLTASGRDGVKQTVSGLKPNTKYRLKAAGRIDSADGENPVIMSVAGAATVNGGIREPKGGFFSLDITGEGYKNFVLADVKAGRNGEKIYGIISAQNSGNSAYFGITDDNTHSTDGVSYKKFQLSPVSEYYNQAVDFDIQDLNKYNYQMREYMLTSEWQIFEDESGTQHIVRSVLGLPTREQARENYMYLNSMDILTLKRVFWNGSYYVGFLRNQNGVLSAENGTQWSFKISPHYMTYVSADMFRNIPLNTDSMGDYVKYRLKNDFSDEELMNIYSAQKLTQIKTVGNAEVKTEAVFDNFKWDEKSLEFVTDSNGCVTVEFYKNAGGLGYIDDINIVEIENENRIDIENADEISAYSSEKALKRTFLYDEKSFTVLKNENGKSLVLCNGYFGTAPYDTDGNQRFDIENTANIGFFLNNFVDIPIDIKENLDNNHIWKTEAGSIENNSPIDYETKSGIALLSYEELMKYGDMISRDANYESDSVGWWLRSGAIDEKMTYLTAADSKLLSCMNSKKSLGIRPVICLDNNFFKTKRIPLTDMGDDIKQFIKDNYTREELKSAGYSDSELIELGKSLFDTVQISGLFDGAKFTADGNEYILTDSIREIDGKKYLGVLSASANGFWAHNRMFLKYDEETINNSEKLVKIVHGTKDMFDGNIKDIQDYISDFSAFSGYLAPPDTKWEMYRGTPDGGVYENQSIIINAVGTVGLPSEIELYEIYRHDAISPKTGTSGIAGRTLKFWATYFYISAVNFGSSNNNVSVNSDNSFLLAENYSNWNNSGSTYYIMTYVSEDYFKISDTDMTKMGEYAKKILKNNFTYADFEGLSKENKALLFNEALGENVEISAYMTDDTVDISLCNNSKETISKGSVILTAVYDNGRMINLKETVIDSDIKSGECTTMIPISIEGMLNSDSVKVMLWNGGFGLKPLADSAEAK